MIFAVLTLLKRVNMGQTEMYEPVFRTRDGGCSENEYSFFLTIVL